MLAIITSFVISLDALSLKYCGLMKHDIIQINFDGGFVYYIIFFPIYLYLVIHNPNTYSV